MTSRAERGQRATTGSASSASPATAAATRTSCPAASASASPSPAPSPRDRGSCCSTSRSPASTRTSGAGCARHRRVLRSTGTPALFVTHDQAEALSIGDRVAVMRPGRIEQVGEPDDVFHRPVNRFVAGFMGEATFLRSTPRIIAPSSARSRRTRPSMPAQLVVRPDDVAIAVDPSAPGVKATVVAVEFHGPTHVLAAAAERHDRDVHPAARHRARDRQRGGGDRGRRTSLARPIIRCRQGR